jgi:competence protein ComEA
MRLLRHTLLPAALFVLIVGAAAQSELPAGTGQAALKKVCSGCHDLSVVTQNHATRDRWEAIVEDMVSRGAEATDEEQDQIVQYLAEHFGPAPHQKVNINKATADELVKALAIPAETAGAIVQYRAKNGNFKDLEALKNVPGVDGKRIDELKEWIEF